MTSMKVTLFALSALLLINFPVYALRGGGSDSAYITQAGNNGTVTTSQTANGNPNTITVTQYAGSSNETAEVTQAGISNLNATIDQKGTADSATAIQKGENDFVWLDQSGEGGNSAKVTQGTASETVSASIIQVGSSNMGEILVNLLNHYNRTPYFL